MIGHTVSAFHKGLRLPIRAGLSLALYAQRPPRLIREFLPEEGVAVVLLLERPYEALSTFRPAMLIS